MTDRHGTIYLICFEQPFKHARHYLGWASDLDRRIEEHRSGKGARLLSVVNEAGISWEVVRTWDGVPRDLERNLKKHSSTRLCPRCKDAYKAKGGR